MNDLVERLRGAPEYFRVSSLRLEAADRIKELERKLSELQNATVQVRGVSIPIEDLVK